MFHPRFIRGPIPCPSVVSRGAAAAVVMLTASAALGQAIRVPLTLPASPGAERMLAGIVADWQQEDLARVVEGIVRFDREHRETFLPIVSGRALHGELIIDLLVSQLPPAAREELARRPGFSSDRVPPVVDWADRLTEGDHQWRDGRIDAARTLWSSLAPEVPPSERRPRWRFPVPSSELEPQALARLAAADVLEGRLRSARRRQRLLAERFPQLDGHLAGKEGTYAASLDELIREAADWKTDDFFIPPDNSRLPVEEVRVDFVRLDWTVPLQGGANELRSRFSSLPPSPVSLPAVWGEVVLLQDATGLRGLSLRTGQSAWPFGDDDPGVLLAAEEPLAAPSPVEAPRGTATWSGSVVGSEWFGRMGPDWISPGRLRRLPSESRIVAVDLPAEGRLRWCRSAGEFGSVEQTGPWLFSGEPVADAGRLYVPLRSGGMGQTLHVVCLDAASGETVWTAGVGTLLAGLGDVPVRGGDRLLVQGEALHWNIQGEAVLSMDLGTGTRRWLTSLSPTAAVASNRIINDLLTEPGRLYALAPGAVTAFDPATGSVDWMCRFRSVGESSLAEGGRGTEADSLLGICDDVLVVTGERLRGIDRFAGTILWECASPVTGIRGHGRGLLLGRSILWPTLEELWTVDALTGRVVQRDALRLLTGIEGGNLLLVHNRLLVAGSGSLAVFEILTSPSSRRPSRHD